MPFYYAIRDAFGCKDVWEDVKGTAKGRGISYQAYEPAEGTLHLGSGRMRRIKAGLRYSKGGKVKYWIPTPGDDAKARGETGPLTAIKRKIDDRRAYREGYAPLLPKQAHSTLHDDSKRSGNAYDSESDESDAPSLSFDCAGPEDEWEESMYIKARKVEHFGYPNVDVSREDKKRRQREEEDAILAGRSSRNSKRPISKASQERRDRLAKQDKKGKGKGKGKEGPGFGVYGACESYRGEEVMLWGIETLMWSVWFF